MKYRGPIKSIKVLLLFLALSVLLAAILPPGRAVHAVDFNGFDGGTGTLSDPYLVSTPAQLDAIRNNLSKSFKLTADIDLSEYGSGAGWVPIGTLGVGLMFKGNIDGDGHSITNLKINRPTANYVGLFGVLSGGSIKNLRLIGPNITAQNYAGPLAGRVWGIYEGQQSVISNSSSSGGSLTGAGWLGGLVGDSLRNAIDNCYSSTAVTGTNSVIGGLVGVIGQGTIDKSYATGNVKAGGIAVGGLVGFNSSVIDISLPSLIRTSYATGNVEGNKSVGGLVGINENSASSLSLSVISDSYAVGRVKGAERVGGLVGYNHTASILNSYAIGAVEGTTERGGLVGASATDRILLSYYDKETTGINEVNQYSKSTEQMKTSDTYTGWEFNGTWAIYSSIHGGYPYLPVAVLTATAALGQGAGTTKLTAAASAGNRLVVQVSANDRAAPGFGDVVPSSGVTDPYLPGLDIEGVDAATNKYISVYEANKDNKVVKFTQITLTEDDILTYAIDELGDQILGALTVGYVSGSQSAHSVTVTRRGTGDLSSLSVEASGGAFTVTQPAVTTLDAGVPSTSFVVTAKDGLAVGTHTSIVTVSADHMTPRTFTVTQVVNAPGAPSLQITNVGNAQATLEWSAINGSTSYRIYKRISAGVYDREEATVTSATYRYSVTGLVNGTNYNFIVRAVIGVAEGADSNEVSATPMTVPGAPTNVMATAGDGQASVAFAAPADDGGSSITSYTVQSSPGGINKIGTASPIVITGLSNGTIYTFTVSATNSKGDGPASETSNAVMHPIGVPIQQSPIEGDKQVTLKWSAVGEATGYRIYKSTVPGTDGTLVDSVSPATLSYTVTGLTNNTSYYFTIRAMNGGIESAASNEVDAMPVRWAGPGAPAGTFAGGKGIVEDPYLIANAAQLNAVRNYLNGSFKLAMDIDLSGYADAAGWEPIGSNDPARVFSGNMDGDRYVIKGLKINRPTDDYVGLFGFVTGNVANLTLDAANIVGRDYVGGVAGFVKYGAISNSRISGAVTGNNDVGGLVGKVFPGKVGNSFSTANVTGFYRIGGLVGSGSDAAIISESHSAGTVTGVADSFYVGGLVGQIDGSRATVRNSYATGEVQGGNQVGGLVGASLAANIETSYSVGDVTAIWSAGGLVGMNNFGTVTDSYTRSSVTLQIGRIGSFVGYNAGTAVIRNYAAGAVTGERRPVAVLQALM
ncbi:GLUG motif-containing protein [Cohnella herbarum]|uniref:Fibronectin type-III domain-containing protein n=1 Tax=Cohnella herbarum TaxID=2728023 RepID=A0A7Z2VFI9_9BACL|nr:GLUG motif-containing protein [Cohnella herbarum]QJD81944.1 hypothetical protein HH215_01270 [Cohnella herbarum]